MGRPRRRPAERGSLVSGRRGRDRAARHPPREQAPAEERPLERGVPVHAPASEPGHLARRVQAGHRLPPAPSTRAERSVSRPPRVLRVSTRSRTATSGPAAASSSRCGAATRISRSPRYERAPRSATTCRSLLNGLAISRSRATTCRSTSARSSGACGVSAFIPRRVRRACAARRSPRRAQERPDRRRDAGPRPPQDVADRAAGEVGVLLRARERELLLDDALGGEEPRVLMPAARDVGERAEGVEAGVERHRQPPAERVEPQRRRAGQDADAVPGPHRVVVRDALGVVPHPVAVHQSPARRLAIAIMRPSTCAGTPVSRSAGGVPAGPASWRAPARGRRRSRRW